MKKVIVISHKMKRGILDDDYTLYDNGEVLHEYDKHTYPSGYNLKETFRAEELSESVKNRLLEAASDANKEKVRRVLGLD